MKRKSAVFFLGTLDISQKPIYTAHRVETLQKKSWEGRKCKQNLSRKKASGYRIY